MVIENVGWYCGFTGRTGGERWVGVGRGSRGVELYLFEDGIWCWFSVRVNGCALGGEWCGRVKDVCVCVWRGGSYIKN